jgi:apolipoprotein D and lipocalin family protein
VNIRLIGDPARKYLWILSRTPRPDDATYSRAVAEATAQGFETARLEEDPAIGVLGDH